MPSETVEDQSMTALSFVNRTFLIRIAAVTAALTLAFVATHAEAKRPPRVGGHVHVAWPKIDKGKPKQALAKYLAEQVGALRPPKDADTRSRYPRSAAVLDGRRRIGDDPGRQRPSQFAAASRPFVRHSPGRSGLRPPAQRLLHLRLRDRRAAFSATGDRTQAEQLLDQLAALQRTDGSIDYAFDTLTGASDPHFWAGTIAWTGYAAELYRTAYKSNRYGKVSDGVSTWLTSMQQPNGLIKGGPTVTWASTLHNIVAWNFFTAYAANNSGQTKTKAEATAEQDRGWHRRQSDH